MGLLIKDHVVCSFKEMNQCYVAVGQSLHLKIPQKDWIDLKITNLKNTTSLILKYEKPQSSPPTPRLPRWQFVNDNKTMILTSAERSDSGTYTLNTFNVDQRSKGSYTLQVTIEAQVSSVKLSYSCLPTGVMKVNCSADGDNLHFSWSSDFNTLPQLENGTSTVILEQDHQGKVTCHVENHISRDNNSVDLHQCPGSLFQDHVVCRFTQRNQCYVAVGQQLDLQMPWEDGFELKLNSLILKYRKKQSFPPTPHLPRWQFVNDNKTMILTSAERNDSGTYTLNIFNVDGRSKGSYTLQVTIEAQVSSVNVSYSCLTHGVVKVNCSADGDNLHFSWSSDSIISMENDNKTLVLDKKHNEKVTCYVKNNISCNQNSIDLLECVDLILPILSSVCGILIVLAVLGFRVYKKKQGLTSKEAPSQDNKELVYAEVTHTAMNRTETRPSTSPGQYEGVEYGTVVTSNQKKKEDEVQYGELVFNTPAQKKSKVSKVQEECVYSGVQHSQ